MAWYFVTRIWISKEFRYECIKVRRLNPAGIHILSHKGSAIQPEVISNNEIKVFPSKTVGDHDAISIELGKEKSVLALDMEGVASITMQPRHDGDMRVIVSANHPKGSISKYLEWWEKRPLLTE